MDKKVTLLKCAGIAVFVLTAFIFISSFSYLFTWKSDQSLMADPDMMEQGVEVANWGGKLGYNTAVLLVARCFGLGSFALIVLLGAVAARLFFRNRQIGLIRTAFITVSGAFLSSLLLSYLSVLFGSDTCFGGGLGGDAGYAVVMWMSNLVGFFVTALLLISLTI